MSVVFSSGTQAATLNTEHTLETDVGPTGGATFFVVVQAPAAATFADVVLIRVKRETRSADDVETLYEFSFRGGGSVKVFQSPYLPIPDGIAFIITLEQLEGTGRTWPWSVETV